MRKYLWLLASLVIPFPLMAQIEVGAEAPRISATIETGDTVSLGESYGDGPVLIYFYPKSDTPGCTRQACNIRDNWSQLLAEGITVYGISRDTVEAQAKFKEKYNLPFHLIADKDGTVGEAFGMEPRNSGSYPRQSFLIVDGHIVWRDLSAKPDTQSMKAMQALEAFKNKKHAE